MCAPPPREATRAPAASPLPGAPARRCPEQPDLLLLPGQGPPGRGPVREVSVDLREVALAQALDDLPLGCRHFLHRSQTRARGPEAGAHPVAARPWPAWLGPTPQAHGRPRSRRTDWAESAGPPRRRRRGPHRRAFAGRGPRGGGSLPPHGCISPAAAAEARPPPAARGRGAESLPHPQGDGLPPAPAGPGTATTAEEAPVQPHTLSPWTPSPRVPAERWVHSHTTPCDRTLGACHPGKGHTWRWRPPQRRWKGPGPAFAG